MKKYREHYRNIANAGTTGEERYMKLHIMDFSFQTRKGTRPPTDTSPEDQVSDWNDNATSFSFIKISQLN